MNTPIEFYKNYVISNKQEFTKLYDSITIFKHRHYNQPLTLSEIWYDGNNVKAFVADNVGTTNYVFNNTKDYLVEKFPTHSHDYYEFMFVTKNSYDMTIADKNYKFLEGWGLLLNKNTEHTEFSNFFTAQTFYLGIEDGFFDDYKNKFGNLFKPNGTIDNFIKHNKEKNVLNNKDYIIFKPSGDYSAISSIFSELKRVFSERPPYMQAAMYYLVGKLFSVLEDGVTYNETYVDLGNFSDFKIAEYISDLIAENRGNITRKEIAERLGYSENYLYRVFKKTYGYSIKEYCQKERIKYASELLSDTTSSIAEIAFETGFENRTQFYRIFQKTYACTPKEYREKLGK